MKDTDKILNLWVSGEKRKKRITGNDKINEAVWEWFVGAGAKKSLSVSGPILQTEASRVAEKLQILTFKASSGSVSYTHLTLPTIYSV